MIALYRLFIRLCWPLFARHLQNRLTAGKEDPKRFPERLGQSNRRRPDGVHLVWIHGASVGEAVSALPLVQALLSLRDDLFVLVTTGTVTSARLLEQRLPGRALHQFVPVDHPDCIRRFLDRWKPDLAIWMESEFWPNLILETAAERVPMVLLNGRVSDRSFGRWQLMSPVIRPILSSFTLALGQTRKDADRLSALGAPHVLALGNLKFAAPPLPADPGMLSDLKTRKGSRPCWIAASTHDGEERLAAGLHKLIAQDLPNLLTVIVPRHPERGDAIAREVREAGLRVALRSKGQPLEDGAEVYIADTIGELGLFFRLADVVFMGKSLVPMGGQNPLEPARLGKPVLFGPHMANFEEIAQRMVDAGAARQVTGENGLLEALQQLLIDKGPVDDLGKAAQKFAEGEAHVLERVMAELKTLLDRLRPLTPSVTPKPEPVPEPKAPVTPARKPIAAPETNLPENPEDEPEIKP